VVALDLAVHANGSVALKAEEFEFDAGVDKAVADDFGFVCKFCPFVLMHKSVVVVRLIARDTKVGIFRLAIFPGDVVLAEFAGYFLRIGRLTSLSSLYFDSLMVKWTI